MAAVAQEKGLGFGEAIGKELGIVDGCVEINQCVRCRNSSLCLGSVERTGIATPSSRCHVDGVGGPRGDSGRTRRKFDFHTGRRQKIELPAILG